MTISTAVDPSVVARVLGIETVFRNLGVGNVMYLPQRCALVGQGATASTYATTKAQVYSSNEVGATYGYGSPLHLAAMQLLPVSGDGIGSIPLTVYPLEDDGAAVAAAGDITPTVGSITQANYYVVVNNIRSEAFTVEVGDAAADVVGKMVVAVNAVPEMPVVAADGITKLDLTAKWKGPTGNDIYLEVTGPTDAGMTWAYTQPTGGATNPSITGALAQVGNVWETMMLNCLDIADTTILEEYRAFGEGRWGALVRKPLVVFTGNTATTVAAATAVSDARGTDRINAQLVAPASNDLPFVVAARQLARIIKLANNNPPHDYGSQQATGLVPGADGSQWTFAERDTAVKAGSSTIDVRDGVVHIGDVVTFYHPTGDPLPAYRYVVDIVKLQNIVYNLDIIFAAAEWDGAPLIPDEQPTTNPTAKKPRMAKAAVASLCDSLGYAAIISDPEFAKESILCGINESNPKRLDLQVTMPLAGNTNVKSVTLYFGFYFGAATIVG